jgi:Uma2 family endonuclease
MSTAILPPSSSPFSPRLKLLTAADLAVLPTSLPSGDVRYELDDGRLVVMPPLDDVHARRQAKIISYLMTDAEDRLKLGEVRGEVGIILRRDPDRVVGADGAFILTKSLPVVRSKEGFLEKVPEIVIEIRSKNDTTPEVVRKTQEYLAAGIVVVWVLDPDARTVTECRSGQLPRVFAPTDALTCDPLPGFTVPVARLFAGA